MSRYIEQDRAGQPITPLVVLANKNGHKLGVLDIDESTLIIKIALEDSCLQISEMSCDVHKYTRAHINPLWDHVKDFKLLHVVMDIPRVKPEGIWYEITVEIDDQDETVKHITGTMVQNAELSQAINYDVEIRTEGDINRDDYIDTIFYNPNQPEASIIHRVLHDKAPHYSICHVDESLVHLKRTFQFSGEDVLNCLKDIAQEVDCIVTFGETSDENSNLNRTISFYDAKDYCPACGKRGDFENGCTNPLCDHSQKIIPRYGINTGIFINKENLGEGINLSTNADEIKNCYRLSAGDSDMTAAVINCNPSGSQYIWRFTDDMKTDMSSELLEKINSYNDLYDNYRYYYQMPSVSNANIENYNSLVNKYKSYSKEEIAEISSPIIGYKDLTLAYYYVTYLKEFLQTIMIPYSSEVVDTTATEQLALYNITKLGVRTLSSISKTNSANEVEESVKLYVDTSRYSIKVETTSYSKPEWTGSVTLTSYTDEKDTASKTMTITFSEATGDYIKQQIEKFIKKKETILSGIKNLLESPNSDFQAEIKKYSLDFLSIISQVIDAVLDILDEAGITAITQPDVYEEIYEPLSQKKNLVDSEMSIRETEVESLETLNTQIEAQQKTINESLDLKSYLGETLWIELLAFRREDTLENSSFISNGLSMAELIQNAQDFFDRADEDIAKKAEAQYSISCDLKNLIILLSPTFASQQFIFGVGDWLRVEVDGKIFKLRLTEFEIDYEDLTTIKTEFTDVKRQKNIFSNFATMKKQTNNLKNELLVVSQEVDETSIITDAVNEMVSVTNNSDGSKTITGIAASHVIFNNKQNLEDYLDDIIQEVNGNLYLTLTNEFQAVSTDENGENGDFSECFSDAVLYYGSDDVSNSINTTWNIIIPDDVTATWDGDSHTINVTNITNDYAIIEIRATYTNLEVKKNFIVKKIKSGTSPIIVEIESSGGNIFKNRGISTQLKAIVKQGNKDISDKVTNYHWIKYDKDGNVDETWSRLNTQIIQITPEDLWSKAIFKCEVSFD